ncbi:MAG: ketoacyl-ACP synthase III [Gemmatimonadota bacterium]
MGRQRSSIFTGSGRVLPARKIGNRDFLEHEFFLDRDEPLDPSRSAEVIAKFEEITEISERRYALEDRVASDLGVTAAERALADAELDPETLDYIIVAHNFGDVRSDRLYLDFCPRCPGWLQGVIQAHYFLQSGDASSALIVGAETLSRVVDPHDRDSMIYADGAGAAVLEARDDLEDVGILSHVTRSDTAEHARLISMGPSYDPGHEDHRLFLKMQGRRVYEYALQTVPGVVQESLERAGLTLADVTKVLIHQANAKMDHAILKRLFRLYRIRRIPDHIMPMTISWLGNSSVATLPTLFDLVQRGEMEGPGLSSGDVVVFASVGAGMNVNSVVYRVP